MGYNYDPRYRVGDDRDIFAQTPEEQQRFHDFLMYCQASGGFNFGRSRKPRPEIRHDDGSVTREDVNEITGGMAGYTRTFPDGHREMVNTPQAIQLNGTNKLAGEN